MIACYVSLSEHTIKYIMRNKKFFVMGYNIKVPLGTDSHIL